MAAGMQIWRRRNEAVTRAEVQALFDDYAAAFGPGDVGRICGEWAYPAFFSARGKRAALDEAAFRANTETLCRFYAAQGVAGAAKSVLAVEQLAAGLAFVRTADRLTGADGAMVAEWQHGYLLSDTADGLRIVMAMPEEELDAWQRRGTPLGSW
jgi:hypothetical protein